MTPSAQISTELSYAFLSTISGAIYGVVPSARVSLPDGSIAVAKPKSVTLQIIDASNKDFTSMYSGAQKKIKMTPFMK